MPLPESAPEAVAVEAPADAKPACEPPVKPPSTTEAKAGLVDTIRAARKAWIEATARVVAARREMSQAVIAEAQALKAMQAAQNEMKKETEADS